MGAQETPPKRLLGNPQSTALVPQWSQGARRGNHVDSYLVPRIHIIYIRIHIVRAWWDLASYIYIYVYA